MTIYQEELIAKYIAAGFSPIPVKARSKETTVPGWPNLRIGEGDISKHFAADTNIGILTGTPSGGLVDVDIDSMDALKFAAHFLPATNCIFGRASKPSSHWMYRVADAGACERFRASGMIVELRGEKHYTVFPGSVHPSGEVIEFADGVDMTPSSSTWAELKTAVRNIAVATELSQHWRPGVRHHLALAIAAFMARIGWTITDTIKLVSVIATECGDDESEDRKNGVATTYARYNRREIITGDHALGDLISAASLDLIRGWCSSREERHHPTIVHNSSAIDLSTDATAADAFANTFRGKLLYRGDQWYRREHEVYEPTNNAVVQGLVKEFMQTEVNKVGSSAYPQPFLKSCRNRNRINATAELSRAQFHVEPTQLDCDLNTLGCDDGSLLSLSNVKCPHRVVTKRLGVSVDTSAACPMWANFLRQIFDGDEEIIEFVRRAVGYTLQGSVSEQCMFILMGSGANGKSTFLRTLHHLFGDYGGSIPIQSLMAQKHATQLTNDLAYLLGKRFITASEGERDERLAEAKIKLMTGGDRISCRFMHRDLFEYTPQFKLWLATNNLPTIHGMDEAIWRRICLINFPISFSAQQQDTALPDRLLGELPGILNWALKGLAAWRQQGLQPPPGVVQSTRQYRETNDTVSQWITAACTLDDGAHVGMKDLFESYKAWCENSALTPLTNISFGRELSRRKFKTMRVGGGASGRIGIALRTND